MGKSGARRAVRHSKTYWRKGADVEGIDEALELKRLDERLGFDVNAPLIDTSSLFSIDRQAGDKEDVVKEEPTEMVTRRKKRTTTINNMPLKYLEKLKSDSKVPAIEGRQEINPAKALMTKEKLHRKQSKQGDIGRVMTAGKTRRTKEDLFKLAKEKGAQADLWDEEPVEMNYIEDWFARQTKKKGKKRTIISNKLMDVKRNLPPVVDVGSDGASYNPSHAAHQQQLREATAVEQRKEHSEIAAEKATHVPAHTRVTREDILRDELSGLIDEPKVEAIDLDEFESDFDESKVVIGEVTKKAAQPTAEDRLTKRQRRRAAEEKRKLAIKAKTKKAAVKQNEVFSLKRIQKELRAQDALTADRKVNRITRRQTRTARLGKHAFEQADMPVALSDELVSTLRELKPEGDVLHDRWKSLQARNLIAPTKRVKKPKGAPTKKVQSRDVRAMIERLGGEAAKYNHEVINQGFK